MKKFLAVLLVAVTVACMFVACSKADDKNTTQSTTASVENATDKAKIKDSDLSLIHISEPTRRS